MVKLIRKPEKLMYKILRRKTKHGQSRTKDGMKGTIIRKPNMARAGCSMAGSSMAGFSMAGTRMAGTRLVGYLPGSDYSSWE